MILDEVEVVRVDRLSPSFVRVELGGACLADFGVDGPLYDQRIKLVFPHDAGAAAVVRGRRRLLVGHLAAAARVEERGHMRTYTVRDVRGAGADTRLVVDIVLHPTTTANRARARAWAAQARSATGW